MESPHRQDSEQGTAPPRSNAPKLPWRQSWPLDESLDDAQVERRLFPLPVSSRIPPKRRRDECGQLDVARGAGPGGGSNSSSPTRCDALPTPLRDGSSSQAPPVSWDSGLRESGDSDVGAAAGRSDSAQISDLFKLMSEPREEDAGDVMFAAVFMIVAGIQVIC